MNFFLQFLKLTTGGRFLKEVGVEGEAGVCGVVVGRTATGVGCVFDCVEETICDACWTVCTALITCGVARTSWGCAPPGG